MQPLVVIVAIVFKWEKLDYVVPFIIYPNRNLFQNEDQKLLAWDGTLSLQQKETSQTIIDSIQKNQTRLLWAVAGAGKTEMLFEGIEAACRKTNEFVWLAHVLMSVWS